jgi:hypothetical protein
MVPEYPDKAKGIVSVFNTFKYSAYTPTEFHITDPDKLIIYEVLVRDFTATGSIDGVKGNIPYLKSLGVNAIELMPIQEFDGNDSWGYNPCYFLYWHICKVWFQQAIFTIKVIPPYITNLLFTLAIVDIFICLF